jgi:wobble nucleotide-excising tRNase
VKEEKEHGTEKRKEGKERKMERKEEEKERCSTQLYYRIITKFGRYSHRYQRLFFDLLIKGEHVRPVQKEIIFMEAVKDTEHTSFVFLSINFPL